MHKYKNIYNYIYIFTHMFVLHPQKTICLSHGFATQYVNTYCTTIKDSLYEECISDILL